MPADSIETLLDLETPLEKMFAHLFGQAQVTIYTVSTSTFVTPEWQAENPELAEYIFSNQEEFQLKRPRTELMLNAGQSTTHLHDVAGNGLFKDHRCDSWEGSISLVLITEANMVLHRSYRARMRKLMGDDWTELLNTHAPYHEINKCLESSTSTEVNTDGGLLRSTITYETHFNIRTDAWPS